MGHRMFRAYQRQIGSEICLAFCVLLSARRVDCSSLDINKGFAFSATLSSNVSRSQRMSAMWIAIAASGTVAVCRLWAERPPSFRATHCVLTIKFNSL